MRSIINLAFLTTAAAVFVVACEKPKALPNYRLGTPVALTATPGSLTPTASDSTKAILTLNWTFPNYATDSGNMKYILEIDTAGKNFTIPVTRTIIKNLTTSYTGRELNTILLNKGYALGTPVKLDFRVTSSYLNNNEKYLSNVSQVTVTPYADASQLVTAKTSVTGSLATANQLSNTFTWSPSFPGYSGTVTYTLQYDSAGKNFVAPQEIVVGTSVYTKAMTEAEMNTTAINSGIPMDGKTGKVEYRIKATTPSGSAYSNVVNVTITTYIPILRFYMPGGYQTSTGNGTDWTPGNAPELIRDLRTAVFNKLYYIYIYLPANAEFKFTQGRDWAINYGGTNGTLSVNGANLKVTSAGFYRISIDVANLKYDIKQGRMGFVGDATGAGWTPANSFPNYALGAAATNVFVGLTDFIAGGWKLLDSSAWNDGSNSVGETRSYGSNGGDGSTMEVNGPNFPNITTAGRRRVIWDGRDVNNIKYWISPATEMRLVGDGINEAGVLAWDPPTSPQMTYAGNGVWTITVTLYANKSIKFLAGNAWGAFDYEDASGGSTAVGTPRKIKWDGGPDFKTPTVAGSYTITLDEKTQTVTIN
jgi:hypothetical protein